jgi:hypothetical protein
MFLETSPALPFPPFLPFTRFLKARFELTWVYPSSALGAPVSCFFFREICTKYWPLSA